MNGDFWDVTFGGKDTLRLSLGAYNFRNRVNKGSVTYSFEYGEGKRIRVVNPSEFNSSWYLIHSWNGISKQKSFQFGWYSTRLRIEEFTGLSLDPFTHG